MKQSGFLILILCLLSFSAFSQNDSVKRSRNIIFAEIGGAGGYGSVNYERTMFTKKKLSFALRIGISSYHVRDFYNKFNPDIITPMALNVCYGNIHKIEFNFGQTLTSIVMIDLEEFNPRRQLDFHSFFGIGYRFQPDSGGLFFRCFYSPIIEYNRYFKNWAGISVGYSF